MYFCLILRVQFLKNSPVFPQHIGNVPDHVGTVAVLAVVVKISALVGTEFLIGSSNNYFFTFETFFLFQLKLLLVIIISYCKIFTL